MTTLKLTTHSTRKTGDPDAGLAAMFDQVPKLHKHQVAEAVVEAGAEKIVDRAQQLTPRGEQEDRDKRSKKQARRANWNKPLYQSIDKVVRKYGTDGVAIIGPRWPEGNKAYVFTSPRGRRVWYWGKDAGFTAPAVRNWIVQAADETRPAQIAAMGAVLRKKMDRIWQT